MKILKKDLRAVSKELKQLSKKTEKLIKAVDKLEKAQAAEKAKAKRPATRARVTKKTAARKRVAKKAPARKRAVKKAAAGTATDKVLSIIKKAKKGVDVPTLIKKTGLEDKQIRNIVFRAFKQKKIKRSGRGSYVGA
jgi:hypothetical protein